MAPFSVESKINSTVPGQKKNAKFLARFGNIFFNSVQKSLFYQVLVFFLFLSPILFMAAYGYWGSNKDLTEATLYRRQTLAYLAAVILEERFDDMLNIGQSISNRTNLHEFFEKGQWADSVLILKSIQKDFPFIDRLFLTDTEGTIMADTLLVEQSTHKNVSREPWYNNLRQTWQPVISGIYKRSVNPQEIVVAGAIPIVSESQKVIGILVMEIKTSRLVEWTRVIEVGDEGFVYFVDSKASGIGYPRFSRRQEVVNFAHFPVVQKVLEGKQGVTITYNPLENQEMVSAYQPISVYKWGAIAEQPSRVAFAVRDKTVNFNLSVYGTILLIDGLLIYFLFRSIKERKRAEEKVQEMIRVRSEFVSMVSHELRTPLMVIKGGIDAIYEEITGPINGEQKEVLVTVKRNVDRLSRLINNALDYQKLDSNRMEFIMSDQDINGLVKDTVNDFTSIAKSKNLELNARYAKGPVLVHCDRDKIIQVLINLINNAIKFTEKGTVTISVMLKNDQAYVSVEDQGIGIKPEDISKLFKSFSQLDRVKNQKTGGTGLGLSIAQKIVEKHHGTIEVSSVYGQGTTFTVVFPLIKKENDGAKNTIGG